MKDVLRAAIVAHQTGDLARASQLYENVLAGEARNAEVMHLLGVLYHQQGDRVRAIDLMKQAVIQRPNNPVFHANLAEAYRANGEYERAAGCCRAAISLRPDYPEALTNLGLALQGMGRRDEAAEQYHNALRLRPESAAAHNNLGNVERERGRHDPALAHYRRAVQIEPAHAAARGNLGKLSLEFGLTLMRDGQFGDALTVLKHAREMDPANPAIPEFLGDICVECAEFGEAVPYYEQAIALVPEPRFMLHLSLGWALQEDGRLDKAGEQYQIAHQLQPGSPIILNYLGGFHEERGDLAEAEAAYRQAVRAESRFSLPLARLATLLRGQLPEADLAALEADLARPDQLREPRGRLLFGLAHVLDARGQYRRAARCLEEANTLIRESRADRREYDPASHQQFVDHLVHEFDPGFFVRTAGLGHETKRPIFIFGLPRSGTTLVEQVLASHSRIHGAGELRLARQSFEAISTVLDRPDTPLECVKHLDVSSITRLAEHHLERLSSLAGERALRVIDKMPDNYMYLGLLAALFPRATFIHCRRDLRDVAVSCWMTDFRNLTWTNDQAAIASRFSQYQKLMDHWRADLPVPVHEVGYEEMVSDLEAVAQRLVAACGLEWDPVCLEPHKNRRTVRTSSLAQVRRPVYKDSVARWKHYETELAGLFAALPQA